MAPSLKSNVEYSDGVSKADADAIGEETAKPIGAKLRITPKIEIVNNGS